MAWSRSRRVAVGFAGLLLVAVGLVVATCSDVAGPPGPPARIWVRSPPPPSMTDPTAAADARVTPGGDPIADLESQWIAEGRAGAPASATRVMLLRPMSWSDLVRSLLPPFRRRRIVEGFYVRSGRSEEAAGQTWDEYVPTEW